MKFPFFGRDNAMTKSKFKPQHLLTSFTSMRASSIVISGTLGEKNYLLILACMVGIISGLAAVVLRWFCYRVHDWTTACLPGAPWHVWLLPALPMAGIFFCILFVDTKKIATFAMSIIYFKQI